MLNLSVTYNIYFHHNPPTTMSTNTIPLTRPLKYTASVAVLFAFVALPLIGTALACQTLHSSVDWLRCTGVFYASLIFSLFMAALYAAMKLGSVVLLCA